MGVIRCYEIAAKGVSMSSDSLIERMFGEQPVISVTFGSKRLADGSFFPWLWEGFEPEGETEESVKGLGLSLQQQMEIAAGLHPMLMMSTDMVADQHVSAARYDRFFERFLGREQSYLYETCYTTTLRYGATLLALDRKILQGREVARYQLENGTRKYRVSIEPQEPICYVTLGRSPLPKRGAVA